MSSSALADLSDWIGRTEVRHEVLCAEAQRRYAAAVAADLDVEHSPPPLGHWAFFLPTNATSALGPDGHALRGRFLPPIELPRRMFGASHIQLVGPLRLGASATMTSTICDVARRAARSGEMVLLQVERRITQDDSDRIIERQTLIYRGNGPAQAAVIPSPSFEEAADGEVWSPTAVDLFRFSAATFNSHRIHYDQIYATTEEHYPDLVVQGPFTAARLFQTAQRRCGRAPRGFTFRALAPLFAGQSVRLTHGHQSDEYHAVRCDGVLAMSAQAWL